MTTLIVILFYVTLAAVGIPMAWLILKGVVEAWESLIEDIFDSRPRKPIKSGMKITSTKIKNK